MICSRTLTYLNIGQEMTCHLCGRTEIGHIYCAEGHYVCDTCHGEAVFSLVEKILLKTPLRDPLLIAERVMVFPQIPMLGCENAWIAAGALMAALRNDGRLGVTDAMIQEVLQRTRRQAVGGYCGLTGACGIPLGIGACFSVLLDAACPKDRETALTMQILARTISAVAEETGPCCCKNFVRTSLSVALDVLKENFHIELPHSTVTHCKYVSRHPHGCRLEKCRYYAS